MDKRNFRLLLTLSLLIVGICTVIGFAVPRNLPPELEDYIYEQIADDDPGWVFVLDALYFILMGATLAAYLGLYMLHAWGRALFLISGIVGIIAHPLYGSVYIMPTWIMVVFSIDTVFFGAILGIIYLSDFRRAFEGRRKPGPEVENSVRK